MRAGYLCIPRSLKQKDVSRRHGASLGEPHPRRIANDKGRVASRKGTILLSPLNDIDSTPIKKARADRFNPGLFIRH